MTEFDFSEKGLLRLAEKTDRRLGEIAAKPAIAKIMSEYGMTTDPLARGANSLYEHFLFLLRCQMTSDIAFGAISNPGSFRLSLGIAPEGRKPRADRIDIYGRRAGVSKRLFADSRTHNSLVGLENETPSALITKRLRQPPFFPSR